MRSTDALRTQDDELGGPLVLMLGPMTDDEMSACESRFELVKLSESDNPVEALRSRGAEIRGHIPPVDAELLRRLQSLEIISSMGLGYDSINVAEAVRRGVVVTNTLDVLTDDVADAVAGLLLVAVRELLQAERYLRQGLWLNSPFRLARTTLKGRRLGVLGLRRIGMAIASRAQPFGVEISCHRPSPKDVPYRYFSSLADLADHVDTLAVAVPGGPLTKHLVDADIIHRLGDRGVLIDVARGSVVDEAALAEALAAVKLLSAGLDVFGDEPHIVAALLDLPNAVLLPHVGSGSVDTRRSMAQITVDSIGNWFATGAALTSVSECQ